MKMDTEAQNEDILTLDPIELTLQLSHDITKKSSALDFERSVKYVASRFAREIEKILIAKRHLIDIDSHFEDSPIISYDRYTLNIILIPPRIKKCDGRDNQ